MYRGETKKQEKTQRKHGNFIEALPKNFRGGKILIDIKKELDKYGLTEEAYESCLADVRGKINGANDMDWGEIVEKYDLGIHSDTLRKASQTIFGGAFISEYYQVKELAKSQEGYLTQLRLEKEALKRERQKLSDEKLEYNRWLREQSRDELICEKICDSIDALEPMLIPNPILKRHENRDAILCFADTHYGTEFAIKGLYGETINTYSPEIFEKRMFDLLEQVVRTITEKDIKQLNIFSLGDEIDGILRVSQLMKLRYGVVESTIKYAEYISEWLNKLSWYVSIDFYATKGNHCDLRLLDQPKGTFANENMSFIINKFVQERLKDNPNVRFHENESGLIFDKICGYNILGIHGEVKNMETALQKFTNVYGTMIDILVGGHKHHFYAETVGRNREVVSVPSIIGIDDYAMSLGKTSNPGALMFVVEQGKGIVEQTNYKL